jgi:hypothetical protein
MMQHDNWQYWQHADREQNTKRILCEIVVIYMYNTVLCIQLHSDFSKGM